MGIFQQANDPWAKQPSSDNPKFVTQANREAFTSSLESHIVGKVPAESEDDAMDSGFRQEGPLSPLIIPSLP